MSYSDDKPVGSEFPPPPPAPPKDVGAEYPPNINTSPPPPPTYPQQQQFIQQQQQHPYSPTTGNQQNQQAYSPTTGYSHSPYTSQPLPPYSPTTGNQQNLYELHDRSLPSIPQSQTGYANPQQPQQPQQSQQSQAYVQQQIPPSQQIHVVNVPGLQIFSHNPVRVICPHCHNDVITNVVETPGNTAFLWSLVIFCVCFPLMWLPCVLSSCLDKTHSCPSCGQVLAYIKA